MDWLKNLVHGAEHTAHDAADKAGHLAHDVAGVVKEKVHKAQRVAHQFADKAEDLAHDAVGVFKEEDGDAEELLHGVEGVVKKGMKIINEVKSGKIERAFRDTKRLVHKVKDLFETAPSRGSSDTAVHFHCST